MELLEVVNPVAETATAVTRLAPPLDSLEGKSIGLEDNGLWQNFGVFLEKLGDLLEKRYHPRAVITTVRAHGAHEPAERVDGWAEQIDCAILGLGA